MRRKAMQVSRNTKILILGGFLGSGKTTVLLELAKYITAQSDAETPLAILENEIGEVDVDGEAVVSAGYAVKSLFAGCACCELIGQLPAAVEGIMNDFQPEFLIIETTGIAVPTSIVNALKSVSDDIYTCILVDASRWMRIHKPLELLLRNQLESADMVLVNKCDLVDEETLGHVKEGALQYAGCNKPLVCVSAKNNFSTADVVALLGGE